MVVMFAIAGCNTGGGSRVSAPSLSADDAAAKAIAAYDTDRDGAIGGDELKQCPALAGAVERIDKNGDKKLSAEEIAARMRLFLETNSGITNVPCHFTIDGRPLKGAEVIFEPEAFMGSSFKPARGTTDENGAVSLMTEGMNLEGVPYGFFRVRVSKKGADGKETVPARYNEQTTLGQEIAPDLRGDIVIKVTSR
jgi:hypothetical protein